MFPYLYLLKGYRGRLRVVVIDSHLHLYYYYYYYVLSRPVDASSSFTYYIGWKYYTENSATI